MKFIFLLFTVTTLAYEVNEIDCSTNPDQYCKIWYPKGVYLDRMIPIYYGFDRCPMPYSYWAEEMTRNHGLITILSGDHSIGSMLDAIYTKDDSIATLDCEEYCQIYFKKSSHFTPDHLIDDAYHQIKMIHSGCMMVDDIIENGYIYVQYRDNDTYSKAYDFMERQKITLSDVLEDLYTYDSLTDVLDGITVPTIVERLLQMETTRFQILERLVDV